MEIYLPLIFFFIALVYSSVGFGGGSSYLAILGLILSDIHLIRSTALILNLCVVSIGTILYIKNKVFHARSFWPFLVLSIPAAFFCAQWKLSVKNFFIVLGVSLITAGFGMIIKHFRNKKSKHKMGMFAKLGIGGGIGLLSGLSGIGGGIYLAPALHLFSWGNPKKIASLASLFIMANSLAGIAGLAVSNTLSFDLQFSGSLIIAVAFGAFLGSYYSNKKFNTKILGALTAILVIYVGTKLLLWNIFSIRI